MSNFVIDFVVSVIVHIVKVIVFNLFCFIVCSMYKAPSLIRMLEVFEKKTMSQLYSLDHQWCSCFGQDPPASTDSRFEVKVAVLRFKRNLDSQLSNFTILLKVR